MSEPTNRDRLEKIEKTVEELSIMVGKLFKVLNPEPKNTAETSTPKVSDHVGPDEISTTEYLQGFKPRPMPQGEVPFDGQGNIADPSWHVKRNADGDVESYVQIIHGREVKKVEKEVFDKNREDFINWQNRGERALRVAAAQKLASTMREQQLQGV